MAGADWTKDLVRDRPRPLYRLNHPRVTDAAFKWPSDHEQPVASYRPRSKTRLPPPPRTGDYLEAVNLLEEFDDVENAALDEVERFQDSHRRAPMLDEEVNYYD